LSSGDHRCLTDDRHIRTSDRNIRSRDRHGPLHGGARCVAHWHRTVIRPPQPITQRAVTRASPPRPRVTPPQLNGEPVESNSRPPHRDSSVPHRETLPPQIFPDASDPCYRVARNAKDVSSIASHGRSVAA